MTIASPADPSSIFARRLPWGGMLRSVGLSLAYGCAFVGLHHLAAFWATGGLYSLWFPAAGLRFAFLWWAGPRITPLAALAELMIDFLTGELQLAAAPLIAIVGVVSPCLIYGLTIHLVRRHAGRRTPVLGIAPLPLALASVIGPIVACFSALPWAIPAAHLAHGFDLKALVSALVVFSLGDMLGVLIVAPPLIWLATRLHRKDGWEIDVPRPLMLFEAFLLTAVAWAMVWAMAWAGLGLWLAPVLLATCWIGLRTGRAGAWTTMVLAVAIVLPVTARMGDADARLGLHMLLACIAAVGYLAGSFAEAETRSAAAISRRDRLLYQAERLKTLRAMSVAVIHEISQPLSTIAIEARHLRGAIDAAEPDIAELREAAELISRKSADLSEMVRRLRRFGDRGADDMSPIPVSLLIGEVGAIATPEAKQAQVALRMAAASGFMVTGQDIELRQLLLNLVRNAIAASPAGGSVDIRCAGVDGCVHLIVENEEDTRRGDGPGMGVGLLIARSIAEAHGGKITQSRPVSGRFQAVLKLPLSDVAPDER